MKKKKILPCIICAVLLIVIVSAAGCISSDNNDELQKQILYHPDDIDEILSQKHNSIIGCWTYDIDYRGCEYYLEIRENNTFTSKLIANIEGVAIETADNTGDIMLDIGDMFVCDGYYTKTAENEYQLLETRSCIYDKYQDMLSSGDIEPQYHYGTISYREASDKLIVYCENSSIQLKRVF